MSSTVKNCNDILHCRCVADEYVKYRKELEQEYCSNLTRVKRAAVAEKKYCRKKQVRDMVDTIYAKAYL